MTELLKCPFCGGEAAYDVKTFCYPTDISHAINSDNNRGRKIAVFCKSCGAKTKYVPEGINYCAKDIAVEMWNKRFYAADDNSVNLGDNLGQGKL